MCHDREQTVALLLSLSLLSICTILLHALVLFASLSLARSLTHSLSLFLSLSLSLYFSLHVRAFVLDHKHTHAHTYLLHSLGGGDRTCEGSPSLPIHSSCRLLLFNVPLSFSVPFFDFFFLTAWAWGRRIVRRKIPLRVTSPEYQ